MDTILIKLSGEALANKKGSGIDFTYIKELMLRIKRIHDKGYKVGIVCGGGNFIRGRDTQDMVRENADYAGMMGTIINAIVIRDALEQIGCKAYNQSGLSVSIIDDVNPEKAKKMLDDGYVLVFGGGIGKPYYSTDMGAATRAKDINASMIIKLTNVDGVYDKDPHKFTDAKMYDEVSYETVLNEKLGVMDLPAIEICRDNKIDIYVVNIDSEMAIDKILNHEKIGTHVM